jgi:ACS family D-galactonate transporter-like MFS transporter
MISGQSQLGAPTQNNVASTLRSKRWSVVGLLFSVAFINYLDRSTIGLALPAITKEFHLTPVAKGTLLSSFFWSYTLMQIPIGFAIDRLNTRTLVAVLFAIWSLACGFTGVAQTLEFLIATRIVLGIGESIYLPGAVTIVSRFFAPAERGLPSGIFNSGARAGLAIGAPLVGWLIVRHGWRYMFLLVGLSGLIWLIPWLLIFPRNLPEKSSRPASSTSLWSSVTLNRNLLGICLGFFCLDYYAFLFLTWLPDYLVEVRHLSMLSAGTMIAIPYLLFGINEPLGGWISDHLIRKGYSETGTRKVMIAVSFVAGLLIIPAMLVKDQTLALVFIAATSLVGLSTANVTVVLQSCAPPSQVGLWTGIENCAGNFGGALAPVVMGILIAHTGSYTPGFIVACAAMLGGAAAYVFVVGELKPAI